MNSVSGEISTVADTDSIGQTSNTGGSGVAFKTGAAAIAAAHDMIAQLRQRAARLWECDEEQVAFVDGALTHTTDVDKRLSLAQVAAQAAASVCPNNRMYGESFLTPETQAATSPALP